jgi:hypothetical protein
MHIQYIPGPGEGGYQVRARSAGPGQTRFFAVRKYGGHRAALREAEECALELAKQHPPVSRVGKLVANNRSTVSGVRIEWRVYGSGHPYPYVVGHWIDTNGRHRAFAYSIDRNGLTRAVQRALERRKGGGAPVPSVQTAVRRLRKAYPSLGNR